MRIRDERIGGRPVPGDCRLLAFLSLFLSPSGRAVVLVVHWRVSRCLIVVSSG